MEIRTKSEVTANLILSITESEARALDALVGYGFDEFLKVFYDKLGTHYMKNHESGLKSLFEVIRADMPKHLRKIDNARKAFNS